MTFWVAFISIIIIAALAVYIGTANQREAKRVSSFLKKWGPMSNRAIREYESIQNPYVFFSDQAKADYEKRYSSLYYSYINFRRPKQEVLTKQLAQVDSFAEKYKMIDYAQVLNNKAYFNLSAGFLAEAYSIIDTKERFVGYHEVDDFKNNWLPLLKQFDSLGEKESYSDLPVYRVLREASILITQKGDGLQIKRQANNQAYKEAELIKQKDFFDTVFNYPLDLQQRQAVVTTEDNTLVVSSAGSGKTSTIVGKVRYLVNRKNVAPEDILVVTYTRKAAAELRDRMGINGITCSTFHKHAMDTMGLITGSRPTIIEESALLNIFEYLINNDQSFLCAFNKYVTEFSNLAKDDHEYASSVARAADMLKYGLRSPYKDGSGQRKIMKSKQEVQISVILTHLGVDFRYEEPYIIDTSTSLRRKYKPDFVIHYRVREKDAYGRDIVVEKILYYEHFGIDAQGRVPLWFGDGIEGGWQMAQQQYIAGINWKRSIHAQNGTALMETTSADFQREADMEAFIENLLHQHGVPTRRLTEEEKRARLLDANSRIDTSLFSLIQGFITLMKANRKTIDQIINGISRSDSNAERNKAVLDLIIRPVYQRYQNILKERGEYDFTDVLLETAVLCEKKNPYNYRFILVDEFQDISMDKYIYLKSLRKKNPFTALFCVGDDWQSIYRFSGSDMTLFYDFAIFFGFTEECKIETTHRFGQPLLNASTVFILKNPEQKEKSVTTTMDGSTNIYFYPYSGGNELKVVKSIVENIPRNESIFMLGRYRFNADSIGVNTKNRDPNEPIDVYVGDRKLRYLTIHSAKGLEADHVIILDCESGTYGFPSLISDDPILEYVLSGADSFENSEERRVFYVAITRARKCTYCLFDRENPSPFMSEFGEYSKYQGSTEAICPRCHRGYVRVVKTGSTKYGKPYVTVSCSNTSCDYFETVFDDAVYKYQPRQTIKTWSLRSLMQTLGTTHIFLDYNTRVYCLIKRPENNAAHLVIAPNIVVNKHLFEDLKRNPGDYEVSAISHFDTYLLILKRPSSDIFISNSELENAIRFSNSIACRDNQTIIDPHLLVLD